MSIRPPRVFIDKKGKYVKVKGKKYRLHTDLSDKELIKFLLKIILKQKKRSQRKSAKVKKGLHSREGPIATGSVLDQLKKKENEYNAAKEKVTKLTLEYSSIKDKLKDQNALERDFQKKQEKVENRIEDRLDRIRREGLVPNKGFVTLTLEDGNSVQIDKKNAEDYRDITKKLGVMKKESEGLLQQLKKTENKVKNQNELLVKKKKEFDDLTIDAQNAREQLELANQNIQITQQDARIKLKRLQHEASTKLDDAYRKNLETGAKSILNEKSTTIDIIKKAFPNSKLGKTDTKDDIVKKVLSTNVADLTVIYKNLKREKDLPKKETVTTPSITPVSTPIKSLTTTAEDEDNVSDFLGMPGNNLKLPVASGVRLEKQKWIESFYDKNAAREQIIRNLESNDKKFEKSDSPGYANYQNDTFKKLFDEAVVELDNRIPKKEDKEKGNKSTKEEKEDEKEEEDSQDSVPSVDAPGGSGSDGLYDYQINKMMNRYDSQGYIGTIAADQVKSIAKRVKKNQIVSFVMNLDPSTKGGSHWVSVYIDPKKDQTLEYYDSFGREPSKQFTDDIKYVIDALKPEGYLKFKINRIINQSATSSNCGWFAMKFILDRYRGKPFPECTGFDESAVGEKQIEKFKKEIPFNYI
jgi:hypothetical protein